MVITEINSGLGNQMFQYAAGFCLSRHLGTPLKLNLEWYRNPAEMQTPRKYELDVFKLPEEIAAPEEIEQIARPSSEGLINRLKHRFNRNRQPHRQWVYVEPHFHFDPGFYQARSPVMLSGYWQSEKYFLPVASEVRRRFISAEMKEQQNELWKAMIMSTESVSLHVRRGDMISNPEVARVHGSCDLEYYKAAVNRVAEKVKDPVFFIFSDDPAWCRANLQITFPVHFVENNQGDQAYLDMQLMAMCRHNIIANSSFSWWGAWLNNFPGKIVVSPLRWFNSKPHNTTDLIPDGWIRI